MNNLLYFARRVLFTKKDESVSLLDIHNPQGQTSALEPWLAKVVLLADGKHTIQQLYDFLAVSYERPPPDDLEKTIHSVMQRLVDAKVIGLTNEPVILPYYLSAPSNELDSEKAKVAMEKDNYLETLQKDELQ